MTPEQFIVAAMELRHEWIRKNPSREPNVLWCGDAARDAFEILADDMDLNPPGILEGMTIIHKIGTEGMIVCFDIEHKKP